MPLDTAVKKILQTGYQALEYLLFYDNYIELGANNPHPVLISFLPDILFFEAIWRR